jgi:hypothetical protein
MSLDLKLECACCESVLYECSYTYNVAKMWYDIYPDANGMVDIEGLDNQEVEKRLSYAVLVIRSNLKKYKAMEPENGFGNSGGFLSFIERLLAYTRSYPDSVWRAWR